MFLVALLLTSMFHCSWQGIFKKQTHTESAFSLLYWLILTAILAH